jgi:hypothetical protein
MSQICFPEERDCGYLWDKVARWSELWVNVIKVEIRK